jgi:Fe-S-cluster containining protein
MTKKCNGCGLCCKLFYINLSKEEYLSGKFKTELGEYGVIENFAKVKGCGANLLAKNADGSCVYLKNNLCGIHTDRPNVCREFFCTTRAKKFEGMVEEIKMADTNKISSRSGEEKKD